MQYSSKVCEGNNRSGFVAFLTLPQTEIKVWEHCRESAGAVKDLPTLCISLIAAKRYAVMQYTLGRN